MAKKKNQPTDQLTSSDKEILAAATSRLDHQRQEHERHLQQYRIRQQGERLLRRAYDPAPGPLTDSTTDHACVQEVWEAFQAVGRGEVNQAPLVATDWAARIMAFVDWLTTRRQAADLLASLGDSQPGMEGQGRALDTLRHALQGDRQAVRSELLRILTDSGTASAGYLDSLLSNGQRLMDSIFPSHLVLASKLAVPANDETEQVPAPAAPPPETGNVLRLVGKVWRIRYKDGNEVGDLPDRAHLPNLARLLAEPNHRFGALDFYPQSTGAAAIPYQGRDERSDAQALAEYEKEMRRLTQDIKEAESDNEPEEAERLRGEFDTLMRLVEGETGARKRGHKKKCGTGSPAEKADQTLRVGLDRLTKALRDAGLPKLADHLDKCIDNGNCEWRYVPPPGTSPWEVSRPEPRPDR